MLNLIGKALPIVTGQHPEIGIGASAGDRPSAVNFGSAMGDALRKVSDQQLSAKQATEQFSAEQPGVELHDVMISLQKASLSFQQLVQVRNKLVSAYQDVMNMQI